MKRLRQLPFACVVVLLAFAAALIIRQATARQAVFVGAALAAIGLPLPAVSRVPLGEALSGASRATFLVTRGLYSKIPPPMYVFLDLTLLGVVVATRRGWLLAIWIGLVAIQAWQAAREAAVLEEAFPETYRRYREGTCC